MPQGEGPWLPWDNGGPMAPRELAYDLLKPAVRPLTVSGS
jgi:hypothetical protein